MDDLRDNELRKRASHLPMVIRSAWADSTNNRYNRGWNNWKVWCDKYPESPKCPADPFYVALFINDAVMDEVKAGFMETAYLGIRWGHRNAGLQSPTEHPFVKTAYEGAKRILARTSAKNRKEPIDSGILNDLFVKFGYTQNALHTRFLVVCFLGFAGFLRISELRQVRMKAI